MTITRKKRLLMIITLIGCLFLITSFGFKGMGKKVLAQEIESEAVMQEDSNLTEEETARREGLGRNINVLTATSPSSYEVSNYVLDLTKLNALSYSSRTPTEDNITKAVSTSNATQLMDSCSYSFSIGAGVGFFFASVDAQLSVVETSTYEENTYKYYYNFTHKANSINYYLNGYENKSTYANCFSTEFLNDLENLEQGVITYQDFLYKYGTHIIGETVHGARISATYVYLSNEVVVNSDVGTALGVSVGTGVAFSVITDVSVTTALGELHSTSYSVEDIYSQFITQTSSNVILSGLSLSSFADSYEAWAEEYRDGYPVAQAKLVDFAEGGLIPIWDILPDEYTALASGLESCFTDLYEDIERTYRYKYQAENQLDFYGGNGSAENPFLIWNETNLSNIRKFMGCKFKLRNNIEMAILNWNPIGGYYKDTPFQGELDGDNYTISGLRRSNDVAEQNNRIYYGLFGYIGDKGKVKDLKLAYSNINLTGPEVDNSSTRVFVGAVAGFCAGTLDNVHVQNGTVKYDCNTNGIAFVGGLVGLARGATIKNCTNSSTIVGGRYSGVAGGIAGYMSGGTIDFCSNSGAIASKCTGWMGTARTAGIVGEVYSGTTFYITNCSNSGSLSTEDYGGLFPDKETDQMYFTTSIDYQ